MFRVLIFILVSALFQSCDDCEDQPLTRPYNMGVNLFDLKPGSPFFQQAIASFQFTQINNDYSSGCGNSTSETYLKLVNNTNKVVTFDYNIYFTSNNSGNLIWSHQSVASIPAGPGSSLDVGYLNSNPVILTYGTFQIQSINIKYD